MEDMRAGHTAGQQPVDADILGVKVVGDPDLRGYGLCAFVDGEGGDMRVFVDDAGGQVFAGSIDDLRPFGAEVLTDACDLAGFYEDIRALEPAFFFVGPDGSIPDQ